MAPRGCLGLTTVELGDELEQLPEAHQDVVVTIADYLVFQEEEVRGTVSCSCSNATAVKGALQE